MATQSNIATLAEHALGERPLSVVDVGSLGGLLPELEPLTRWIDAVGFDPDEADCAALEEDARARGRRQRFLPYAVAGSDGVRAFHVCRKPASSSLLAPNGAFHSRFAEPERMEVVRTRELDVRGFGPLLAELGIQPEFLKLDANGVEDELLGSLAEEHWASLLGVHVELLLGEVYLRQSSFAAVHAALVSHGLELYEFKRYAARRAAFDTARHGTRAQVTAADALYLRGGDGLDVQTRRRLGVVAALFGHYDAAAGEFAAAGDEQALAFVERLSRRPGPLVRRLATRLIRLGDLGWRLYGPSAAPWTGDLPPDRF